MEKKLLLNALRGNAVENFSSADVNTAALTDLLKEFGIEDRPTGRQLAAHKNEMFAIIIEALDEILPKDMQNIAGQWAEVISFGRDEQVVFKLGQAKSKKRARLSIKRGARSGIYRAAQWDSSLMELDTETFTVGMYVTLEDIILGRVSLAEYYQNILAGFEEIIYAESVKALRSASTLAPASHIQNISASLDINAALDEAVRIARAYGPNVTIFGFASELAKVQNIDSWKVADDRADVRELGHVRVYKGTPIVELPNAILADGAQITWAFKEGDIFVLPSDAKPVKIAFRGEGVLVEDKEPAGGMRWDYSKMMGIGLLLADNVCIVKDASNPTNGQY